MARMEVLESGLLSHSQMEAVGWAFPPLKPLRTRRVAGRPAGLRRNNKAWDMVSLQGRQCQEEEQQQQRTQERGGWDGVSLQGQQCQEEEEQQQQSQERGGWNGCHGVCVVAAAAEKVWLASQGSEAKLIFAPTPSPAPTPTPSPSPTSMPSLAPKPTAVHSHESGDGLLEVGSSSSSSSDSSSSSSDSSSSSSDSSSSVNGDRKNGQTGWSEDGFNNDDATALEDAGVVGDNVVSEMGSGVDEG